MAKSSGLGDNLYVGGYDLSGDVGSIGRANGGCGVLDVTPINKSAYERIGGLRDGGLEFSSFFDDSAGHAHKVLRALPTADVVATYFRGQAIGNEALGLTAKQINYDPTRGADGAITVATTMESNGYGTCWCKQLTAGIRTDTAATNGSSLDLGSSPASYSFGLTAFLQVFTLTGTSVTVNIQDSADNSSFATIASFTAATGVTAERITTSSMTATVRRYLRVATSGTFSNAQFAVAAERHSTTVAY